MTIQNITVSFAMTVPLVHVNKELGIEVARRKVKEMAYTMFLHAAEPFDSMNIIDCPDYPALVE